VTDEDTPEISAHELRYRRLGGGYRREDVEGALAELRSAMRDLEEDLEALRARSAEHEEGLHEARAELEAYRTRESELDQALEGARTALERARRIEAAVSERGHGVTAAVESLRDGLTGLEQAVTELEGPRGEPADAKAEPEKPSP